MIIPVVAASMAWAVPFSICCPRARVAVSKPVSRFNPLSCASPVCSSGAPMRLPMTMVVCFVLTGSGMLTALPEICTTVCMRAARVAALASVLSPPSASDNRRMLLLVVLACAFNVDATAPMSCAPPSGFPSSSCLRTSPVRAAVAAAVSAAASKTKSSLVDVADARKESYT